MSKMSNHKIGQKEKTRRIKRLHKAAPDMFEALKFLQPLVVRECPPGIDPGYWEIALEKLGRSVRKAEVGRLNEK